MPTNVWESLALATYRPYGRLAQLRKINERMRTKPTLRYRLLTYPLRKLKGMK